MKKKLKMENLECANCAAKMEEAISKIDGVRSANINFMFQKLTIETDTDEIDEIIHKANAECRKFEKNVNILL